MAEFGEILEELRKDKSLTQKELSDIIYVTTGTISNYENGHYLPDLHKLIVLADYFDVTLDYLLGRCNANLSPDIFQELIFQNTNIGDFISDFKSLSIDRQKVLIFIMREMKTSMMIDVKPRGPL